MEKRIHARLTSLIQLILLSQFRFFSLFSTFFFIHSFAPFQSVLILSLFRRSPSPVFSYFVFHSQYFVHEVFIIFSLEFSRCSVEFCQIYTDDIVFFHGSDSVFLHSVGRFSFQFVHIIRLNRKRICGFASVPLNLNFFHSVSRCRGLGCIVCKEIRIKKNCKHNRIAKNKYNPVSQFAWLQCVLVF